MSEYQRAKDIEQTGARTSFNAIKKLQTACSYRMANVQRPALNAYKSPAKLRKLSKRPPREGILFEWFSQVHALVHLNNTAQAAKCTTKV